MKSENANIWSQFLYRIELLWHCPLFPSTVPSSYSIQSYLRPASFERQTVESALKNSQSNNRPLHFGCFAQSWKNSNHEIVKAVFKFIKEPSIVYSISYQIIETRIALADFEVWASSGAAFSQAHVNLVLDVTLKKRSFFWLRVQVYLFENISLSRFCSENGLFNENFTCSKLVILMNVFPSNWVIGSHLRNSRDMFGKMFLTSESFSETRDSKLDLAKSDSKLKLPLP